jgi:hypothetical protein
MNKKRYEWFKFFPKDWLLDQELQSCSLEVKGALIQIMCLLHQSREYGVLVLDEGEDLNKYLTKFLGIRSKNCQKVIQIMLGKGLLLTNSDGHLVNKRMVFDHKLSQIRAQSGKAGAVKTHENRQIGEKTEDFAITSCQGKTGNLPRLEQEQEIDIRDKNKPKDNFAGSKHPAKDWEPEDMMAAKYFFAKKFEADPDMNKKLKQFNFGLWADCCRRIRRRRKGEVKKRFGTDNFQDWLTDLFAWVFQDSFERDTCLSPYHLTQTKNWERVTRKYGHRNEDISWQESEDKKFLEGRK